MRYNATTLSLAVAGAFAVGLFASPALHHAISDAHAAAAPLTPQ